MAISLQLESFKLTQFKNYESEQISCSPALTCFTGANGMGKTNLLDAIYYLCMGKSAFNTPDSQIARHGSDFFRLEGDFQRAGTREHIVAKVVPRKKKALERNRLPYPKLSEHVGLLPVVMIAPDDTMLVQEGSEVRRSLVDNTLSQIDPAYLSHLIAYQKLLQQRNALLKQFAEQRIFDKAMLEVYDQQMLRPAQVLYEARSAFIEGFRPKVNAAYARISGQAETVDCTFQSRLAQAPFGQLLEERRDKDRILQRTTAGPHRDDLVFSIGGYPLKRFASQGQLKSFVLALKLAQYQVLLEEKGLPPILLLDDLFDKLDPQRVAQLLGFLREQPFGQTFITDTDPERMKTVAGQSDALHYQITKGKAARYPEKQI
ncbi:DNA replication/repair protein RecF [Phaeodactylibacter luteus]|uniref:DNA replication and repair protein RecF n=1 Tax=Phaeodactylibacter luteus TaxID=1564516 RepID=A0A5C6RLY2_9BACT|nr:DNA replication and repair protein RecF [Phaeodactylibacter luteus]TXB62342.1 DNA replication and repair protein RecF [Phaeodactylibacter luteus]